MRINLYAGPGAGKSTLASWLFAELKLRGYSIELVSEYVKSWAIEKRKIHPFHQVYFMGRQLEYEYRFLTNGVRNIVTDSPVFLAATYARLYNPHLLEVANQMESIISTYEKKHPSVNIFLRRGDYYQQEGRFHDRKASEQIDLAILSTLVANGVDFIEFETDRRQDILEHVLKFIVK
jgi:deoxyadenosine/deoxycytidine kinase